MAAVTLDNLKIYLKITDVSEDSMLSLLLGWSEEEVLSARYPFGYTEEQKAEALNRYSGIVSKVAIYFYSKQGAEGETSHGENGISRTYERADVPSSYLSGITPIVKTRSLIVTPIEDGELP